MSQNLIVDAKIPTDNDNDDNDNNNNVLLQTQNTHTQQQPQQQQQQQSDDQIQYKVNDLLPKQNQKQKLIQQNIKLKTQIYQLALQLDQILQKDKLKKKKYGLSVQQDDQAVKAKKLQLKKQQLQIVEVKNRIFQLKRQLESVFNHQIVQMQEDKLKHVKRKLEEVQDQRDGLIKIKKGQAKAIKSIKNQEEFKEKIDKTHKQVMRIKQQTQKLMEKALQARKQQLNSHQRYVMKTQKIRELQSKLATNEKGIKQKTKPNKNTSISAPSSKDTISNQLITQLQQQIHKLQIQKKQGEKVWQDKIRTIQIQLQFKRQEQQRKVLTLKQKEKQLKLNQIRIRELRKLIKQNIIQENTKKAEDMDMSQYRHKRNIRYIDK